MKKPKKADVELAIATTISMIYLAILTYAALAANGALAFWGTAVFVCLVYICWKADKEEKARLRRRQAQRENLDKAMADLEQWRKERS